MKAAFVINARNKEKFVARAVRGALAQSYPCEIILSDQNSTDATLQVMRDTVHEVVDKMPDDGFNPTQHVTRILQCPIGGVYGMAACNAHFLWDVNQCSPEVEWIFQCSADDYSMPDRVRMCMEAVEANPCSAVASTMFFEDPGEINRNQISGYPRESGYVKAGEGLSKLAYGSVIAGYKRSFLNKVGSCGQHTMDVLYGFLAALDEGFYVVADPQHVHVQHADLGNMGFQGKMRAASGDEALKLGELNHFQLAALYDACAQKAADLHPSGVPTEAWNAVLNMLLGQTKGWLEARKTLHTVGIMPGVI